mmetsp:Transcript_45141/g.125198  ORF Transcript_45141/g.125198 Transcript_45141/m.125198 type:complete len:277 (-) Transcript_45141:69-899(-)
MSTLCCRRLLATTGGAPNFASLVASRAVRTAISSSSSSHVHHFYLSVGPTFGSVTGAQAFGNLRVGAHQDAALDCGPSLRTTGAQTPRLLLPLADDPQLTLQHGDLVGEAFFPWQRPGFQRPTAKAGADLPSPCPLPIVAPGTTSPALGPGPADEPSPRLGPPPDAADAVGAPAAVPILAPGGPCASVPIECLRFTRRRRKSQGLQERWWLEFDPPKANYISSYGRGPHEGHSINKADWPRQMEPVHYKKNFRKRERMRYSFRKNGFELDIPKWGG